jgi:site-specific recombinase XerD
MPENGDAAIPVAVTWHVAPGVTLAEALEGFLEEVRARGRSPRTLDFYGWQCGQFMTWLGGRGVCELGGVDARHIRGYLVELRERGLADNSVHAAARAVQAWLNFCVTEELLEASPMRKVGKPRRSRQILPAFTAADMRRLLAAAEGPRDRALIWFLYDTGVRAAECLALNVGDVDLAAGTVFVAHGKGDKSRWVYLGERSTAALTAYLEERGPAPSLAPLWVVLQYDERDDRGHFKGRGPGEGVEYRARRLSYQGLRSILRRVGALAGVQHCNPHTFRRTFAVTLHRDRATVPEIAGLLGHGDLAALQRYLDLQASDFAAAHRRHGPGDRLVLEDPPGG